MQMAGALDIDASDKAARFIRFCNIFNIPLVTLVDVPGFFPGIDQERGGIIRHGAKMLFAYASCTTPKITVVLRKAYGGSYMAMCSKEMAPSFVYASPGRRDRGDGRGRRGQYSLSQRASEDTDRRAKAAELAADYRAQFASPYMSAEHGYLTDIIEPSETRFLLALALRKTLAKREQRPAKKHGNIPL